MPGVVLINPDGQEEFVGTSRVGDALKSGYTARPGDTTALQNPSGSTTVVGTGDVGQLAQPGVDVADAGGRFADLQGQWDESQYGGVGGGLAALGLGAARGATFGLSDLMVNPEAAAGYARENPGLDLSGNIGGAIATGGVTGLTKGAASLGAALAPGSKAAAALIAGGAEGMAFGAGQATSSLILKNEPLTAESVFTEYGTDIFLGGAFGAAGGLAGSALEHVGNKLVGKSAAKLADNLDPEHALAANSADAAVVPLNSAKGKVLTEDFVSSVQASTKLADDLAEKARAGTAVELDPKTFVRSFRLSRQWLDDNLETAVARAQAGELSPELTKIVKDTQRKARRLYSEIEGPIDVLGRPRVAQRGGTAATEALDEAGQRALAKQLVQYRNLAREFEKHGLGPGVGIGEPLEEVAALERFAANQSTAKYAPEVKEFAAGYEAGRKTFFDKLMVRDGVPKKRQLEVFAEMSPEEAAEVGRAYSQMTTNASKLADAMGADFAVQGKQLADELARIKTSMKAIAGGGAGSASGMGAMETMIAAGVIDQALPDIDGPADEILSLWLAAKMGKSGAIGGSAAAAKSGIHSWVRGTARNIGFRSAARGGGPVVGGIKGAIGRTVAGSVVDNILGNTSGLARSTGRAVARMEGVVGKLAKGVGTGVRKAAPFAPKAYLKGIKFADLDHDKSTPAFEQRAAEIRANVANSYGLQHTVLRNLGDLAMTHMGVADKVVAQADRVMKFLASKLPRDPGNVMRLGKSGWKASDQDIAKLARYARAALDPMGEFERFANGELSPEGAEALRVLYPATFSKFQEHIAANLGVLQEKLSFADQNQLSVLFQIPVNSLMEPRMVKALQATHAADASANPVSQPPPGANATPLSPAQQLLTR